MRINKRTVQTRRRLSTWPSAQNERITYAGPTLINGSELNRVLKTKSLGVIVDTNPNWDGPFKVVKGKIFAGHSSLRKRRNILPQSKLCNVYQAVIQSHLRLPM